MECAAPGPRAKGLPCCAIDTASPKAYARSDGALCSPCGGNIPESASYHAHSNRQKAGRLVFRTVLSKRLPRHGELRCIPNSRSLAGPLMHPATSTAKVLVRRWIKAYCNSPQAHVRHVQATNRLCMPLAYLALKYGRLSVFLPRTKSVMARHKTFRCSDELHLMFL